MAKKDEGSGKFVGGAVLGALAGAVLGLLFAPRSGKETRKIIKDKSGEYAEKGKEFVKDKRSKDNRGISIETWMDVYEIHLDRFEIPKNGLIIFER